MRSSAMKITHWWFPRSLPFSDELLLPVPGSGLKHPGGPMVLSAVAVPRLWNSLPCSMKCSPSVDFFKTKIKIPIFLRPWMSLRLSFNGLTPRVLFGIHIRTMSLWFLYCCSLSFMLFNCTALQVNSGDFEMCSINT